MNILTIAVFANTICSTINVQQQDVVEQIKQIMSLSNYTQGATQIVSAYTPLFDVRNIVAGRHVRIQLGSKDTWAVCNDFQAK
jgi:hypothetical protein